MDAQAILCIYCSQTPEDRVSCVVAQLLKYLHRTTQALLIHTILMNVWIDALHPSQQFSVISGLVPLSSIKHGDKVLWYPESGEVLDCIDL